MYSGVFEDLAPHEIPEDISLFKVNATKYPLLGEVQEYILFGRVEKGDCLYLPDYWWVQNETQSEESTWITFGYETSSKLTDLLFAGIDEGMLEED